MQGLIFIFIQNRVYCFKKGDNMDRLEHEIERVRARLGSSLFLLSHYYQDDAILRHVDAVGDSLELARRAAACTSAQRLVFCGVRFMAETADLLTAPGQRVYMPETGAGCPMADMAGASQAEACAARVTPVWGRDWVPIVYVNSTAALKAFCGRRGGSACTSSNAFRVFRWALDAGKRILFMPDEHLGTNIAHDAGLPDEAVVLYDPHAPSGGVADADLQRARVAVWKGYCHVHQAFTAETVRAARARSPGARVIVHPESPRDAVREADFHGSTTQLIDDVRRLPAGQTVFVGTERCLVERLAAEQAGRVRVIPLVASACPDMASTTLTRLHALLHQWPDESVVTVPAAEAREARLALDRMLTL